MESKNLNCPCKRKNCERNGDCAACKEHHHASTRLPLTTCERLKLKQEKKARMGKVIKSGS